MTLVGFDFGGLRLVALAKRNNNNGASVVFRKRRFSVLNGAKTVAVGSETLLRENCSNYSMRGQALASDLSLIHISEPTRPY